MCKNKDRFSRKSVIFFLLGERRVVHSNFSEAHSPTCYSSYLVHRRASDRGMLRSDSKKIPKWRRRRRGDITEHEIQYGHKPLSQKCNLPISFAYLLIHLLLIWGNWGVVRVMWCKGFILQNNLQPTVQSLQFQITEIRKEALKKEPLILYSFSAWSCSGVVGQCTYLPKFLSIRHTQQSRDGLWCFKFCSFNG